MLLRFLSVACVMLYSFSVISSIRMFLGVLKYVSVSSDENDFSPMRLV